MKAFQLGGHKRAIELLLYFLLFSIGSLSIFFALTSFAGAVPKESDVPTWVSDTQIRVGDSTFTRTVNGDTQGRWIFSYTAPKPNDDVPNSCISTLTFNRDPYGADGGQTAARQYSVYSGDFNTNTGFVRCDTSTNPSQPIANASAVNANNTNGSAGGGSGATGTAQPNVDECRLGINPLTWAICPIVDGIMLAVSGMNYYINELMTVNTDGIFANNQPGNRGISAEDREISNAFYQAWNGFRVIAIGIIVIMALVIIISTAFGFEFLDAYTIRKALPRVLIATIFIALSWPILEFLVTLSNDLGLGIRALIYAPFSDFEQLQFGSAETGILNVLLAGGIVAFGIFGLLSFAITAGLAVLVAFLVLILREMIIIALVILAPIGIACLILPNTQKYWQFWQNTFTAMLLAFPIIAALIATGRVFSAVAYQDGNGTVFNNIIAFIAYFVPYFLLPLAFTLAGGVLARLGAIANDSERGAFDRLKKFRQGKVAENTQKMKEGRRFQEIGPRSNLNPLSAGARAFNRTTVGLGTGVQGRLGLGKRGAEAVDQARRNSTMDLMKSPGFQAIQDDDDALMAATYGSAMEARSEMTKLYRKRGQTATEASANASRAAAAAQASIGFGTAQGIAASQQLVSTGTGYQNLDEMTDTIARVSRGNASTGAGIAGFANAITKQKGRNDLAPGAGNVINDVHAKMGLKNEYGAAIKLKDSYSQNQEAWNSASLYQVANGKGGATKNFTKHIAEGWNSGDAKKTMDAAISLTELQGALPSASGANQQIMIKALKDSGIDYHADDSIETQIAKASQAAANHTGISQDAFEREIRRKARVYDRESGNRPPTPDEIAQQQGG